MELYRNSAVGISLVETLNTLLDDGTIEFSTANHILVQILSLSKQLTQVI